MTIRTLGPNSRATDWHIARRPPLLAANAAKPSRPRILLVAPVTRTLPPALCLSMAATASWIKVKPPNLQYLQWDVLEHRSSTHMLAWTDWSSNSWDCSKNGPLLRILALKIAVPIFLFGQVFWTFANRAWIASTERTSHENAALCGASLLEFDPRTFLMVWSSYEREWDFTLILWDFLRTSTAQESRRDFVLEAIAVV